MRIKRTNNLRKKRSIRSKKQSGGSSKDVKLHVLPPKQGRDKGQQIKYLQAIKTEIGKLSKNLGVSRKIYVLNRDHIYPQGIFVFEKPAPKSKPQSLKSASKVGNRKTKKKQLDKNLVNVNLLLNRKVSFVINKKYLTLIDKYSENPTTFINDKKFMINNSYYGDDDLFFKIIPKQKNPNYITTYIALKDNKYFMTTTVNQMPLNGYHKLNNIIHNVYANGKADGIFRKNDLSLQSGGANSEPAQLSLLPCIIEYNNFKNQFKTLIQNYNDKNPENIISSDDITQKIDDVRQKLVGYYKPKNNRTFTIVNKEHNIFENEKDYDNFSDFKNKIDPPINIKIDIDFDVDDSKKIKDIIIKDIITEDLINVLITIFNIENKYCIDKKKAGAATKLFKIMNQVLIQFKKEIEEQIEKRNKAKPIIPNAPNNSNNNLPNNLNLNNPSNGYSANNEYSSINNNIITKGEIYRNPVERYYDRFAPKYDEEKGGPQLTQEYDPRNLTSTTSGNLSYHFNAPPYLYNFFDY